MSVPKIQTAFTAGEVAPSLFGHTDLSKYNIGLSTARNVLINYRGGAYSRAGTAYCAHSKQPITAAPPHLVKFQFNINQGYCLEFGDQYMRVFSNGAPVVEASTAITGVTQANPAVVTDAAHGYANGDWVFIANVVGMTQLNGNTYVVQAVTANTYALQDLHGNAVNSSTFTPYASGGTASRVFTLTTPWAAADMPLVKFVQSADVMTLVHPNYPPYNLARITATNWTVTQITFAASVLPTSNVVAAATVNPTGTLLPTAYAYVVTTVDAITGEESIASAIANVTNSVDIATTAGSIIIDWTAVAGAGFYNIYKAPTSYNTIPGNLTNAAPVPIGSLFGYIGSSYGTEFVDTNVVPDLAQVPPTHKNPFAPGQIARTVVSAAGAGYTFATIAITSATGSGFIGQTVVLAGGLSAVIILNAGQNYRTGDVAVITGDGAGAAVTLTVGPLTGTYPGAVAYFQQRRVYAASNNNPDTFWMSQPGQYNNMDSGVPTSANDAITGTPWAQQVNGIQFMIPMPGGLVIFTGLGAWLVGGAGSSVQSPQPITPSSEQAIQQAFNGCSPLVPPLTIGNDIIYMQAKGYVARDLSFNYWLSIFTGADITELSSQLFTGFTIKDWASCEEPYKIAWAVRSDGNFLSLTYVKEQEVFAWARHDTEGTVQSVCNVIEPPVDALYLAVARQIATTGSYPFYAIERMDNRIWSTAEDPWCVDCGLVYPMPTPAADLFAIPANGAAIFEASAAVFSAGDVGSVIRAGNGVATITGVLSPTVAFATWNLAATATVPNGPSNNMIPQAAGTWTMTKPITTVGGLQHLAGMVVTGLADGIAIPPQYVSPTGTIVLSTPASNIKVGLGFLPQVQSLYLDTGQPTIQGRRKSVPAVTVRVEASLGLQAGSNQVDGSTQVPMQIAPVWTNMAAIANEGGTYTAPGGGTVTLPFTGDLWVTLTPKWGKPGQVAVQQPNPYPMQVTALVVEAQEGDTPEVTFAKKEDAGRGRGSQMPPGPWGMRR